MSITESQMIGFIKERRSELLDDARRNEDELMKEIPGYLTKEEQTAKQIVEMFNRDYGTSLSEDRAKLILNSLADGNNIIRKETKNNEDYFSIINPQ